MWCEMRFTENNRQLAAGVVLKRDPKSSMCRENNEVPKRDL